MKKFIQKILGLVLAISALTMVSCESARDDEDAEYSSMDEFYTKHRQEEQEFIIDSAGTGPIIGKQGTQILVDTSIFMLPGGGDLTFPFTLKLIELYPESDFIEFPMSTVSNSTVTEAAGAIRVRAYKNNVELVLKPGKVYGAAMTNANNLKNTMAIFYGENKDTDVNWTPATDQLSTVVISGNTYAMAMSQMGWATCAKTHTGGATTIVTFKAKGSGTDKIDVFIIAKDYFSVVKVKSLQSIQIPTGENVTVVAMAMDQNKKYRLHYSSEIITSGKTIDLDMKIVTEQEVLDKLAAL